MCALPVRRALPVSHAAVIGINDYRNGISPLRSAVNDARKIAALLEEKHGYTKPRLLVDGEATHDAVVHLLEDELPRRVVEPESSLVIYFAGHGVARGDGDEDEGPQGFLLPQDAHPAQEETWLPMQQTRRAMEKLPCRHLLVILDCCFAGSFRWAASRGLVPVGRPLYKSQYRRFVGGKAWQVLTSASYNEKALDVTPGLHDTRDCRAESDLELGHSPFARALIEGLDGEADSWRGRHEPDGVITATELYQWIFEELVPRDAETRARQTPGLWPLTPDNKGEFVFLTPGEKREPLDDPELEEEANPWLALKAYSAAERELFFGRGRVVDAILARLLDDTATPFVAVVGASGTGKSSVVRAGVVPRLEEPDEDDGREPWSVASISRLGSRPDQVLEAEISRLEKTVPHRRKLLFIDQFEEIFTQCRDTAARRRFLSRLSELVAGGTKVLITLRSDFEPRLTAVEELADLVAAGRYVVPQPTSEELRRIVEEPAKVKALYFEPEELVGELVDEVMAMPGALPLLSFTLSEMYQQAFERRLRTGEADRALRREDYEATGGVVGSIHRRATELHDSASPRMQRTIRQLFLRLCDREGGRLARRRASLEELRFPTSGEQSSFDAAVDLYSGRRLLVRDDDSVEPAHDTLILAWEKLLDWLVVHGSQRLRRELWNDAVAWDRAKRAPIDAGSRWQRWWQRRHRDLRASERLWHHDSRLLEIERRFLGRRRSSLALVADALRGFKLSSKETRRTVLGDLIRARKALSDPRVRRRGLRWAMLRRSVEGILRTFSNLGSADRTQAAPGELNCLEKAFVQASRERIDARRAGLVSTVTVAFLALLITVLRVSDQADDAKRALVDAERLRRRAEAQIRVGLAGELIADEPAVAAALLREIERPDEIPMAFEKMLAAVPPLEVPGHFYTAVFNDAGRLVLTKGDGSVEVHELDEVVPLDGPSRRRRRMLHVTVDDDGKARIWKRTERRELVGEITSGDAKIVEASISLYGDQVLSVDDAGRARLWTIDGRPLTRPHEDVDSAHYGPDGDRVVIRHADSRIGVWRVSVPALTAALRREAPICIAPTCREFWFGEPPEEARAEYEACLVKTAGADIYEGCP